MKKFICSSVMLILLFASIGIADEHFPFLGKVTSGPVNVRAGANTNFEALLKLDKDAQVTVLAKSYEWYKIELPDQAPAYVRADYIKELERSGGEITGSKVNIRCKPDSNASVLGQLVKGDIVKLQEKKDDWWRIDPPAGSYAWIHGQFVASQEGQVLAVKQRVPLLASAFEKPQPVIIEEKPQQQAIHVQGVLQRLDDPLVKDVNYKIVLDGKVLYLIKDAPGLERFTKAMVKIDGIESATYQHFSYPLLLVNTITLLL